MDMHQHTFVHISTVHCDRVNLFLVDNLWSEYLSSGGKPTDRPPDRKRDTFEKTEQRKL